MAKRLTIGFIVSGIMDAFTKDLCSGVRSALGEDVNLMVIPVKYIDRDFSAIPDPYEYQYKNIGSLVRSENVDGLLIAADCVGCLTTKDNLLKFMDQFKGIPTVLVASKIDGYVCVSFDNKQGIYDGMQYAVEKLGCKRPCMLAGFDDNSDALERKEAFIEMLDKYGIPYGEETFEDTNLTHSCEEEAERLLDNNPDTDLIFCVNDDTALGLYAVMKKRGLVPGKDIKVFGFDNSISAAKVIPALSTIEANPMELCGKSYELLMDMLAGREVSDARTPTRFILRDSFGKISDDGAPITTNDEVHIEIISNLVNLENLDDVFDKLFYRYRSFEKKDGSILRYKYNNFMVKLLDYSQATYVDIRRRREVIEAAESFIMYDALDYADMDTLIPYIEKKYSAIAGYITEDAKKHEAYEMFIDLIMMIVRALDNKNLRITEEVDNIRYSMKTMVKDTMSFKYGNDQSYEALISDLGWMQLKNAYIYIFDKPIIHLNGEEFKCPEGLCLKAALINGKSYSIPADKQRTPLSQLFVNEHMPDRPYQMVLSPIYYDETVYGCAICDLTDMVYANGEMLFNQFGSAARVIDLLKTNDRIQKELEENLNLMKQHNIELDMQARNDALTGILNRRGFLDVANKMLSRNRAAGKRTIVAYADMNNLKIINDRFGHEEGDFALRTISEVLTFIIGSDGVVGRIGGDEYTIVYVGDMTDLEFLDKIKTTFSSFNETSPKPYNVTVSCGVCNVSAENTISLSDALQMADQDLYNAKRNKDLKVIKAV